MNLNIDFSKLESTATLREWSLKNRLLRGQPFSILPPLNQLYDDPSKEVFIEKAAQVTISEYLINLALFCCDTGWVSRGNCLYIFPAVPQISDFSNARIEPVIMGSPYLLAARQQLRRLKGAPTNNIQLKEFRKGFLYLRGSNNRNQIISVDADVVIFDEVDEMTEGTIEAGKKRAGSSKFPFYRGASTPKYPKTGIDALIEKSDRKVWMVKCSKCSSHYDLAKLQDLVLKLPNNPNTSYLTVVPSDKGTYCHIGSRYYVGCPKCSQILNVWNGEWVPTYTDDPAFGGYHIPKLISDHLEFDELAKRVEDERAGRLSEISLQEFYNSDLGLPRAPQGFQLQFHEILACAETVPDDFVFRSDDWFSWIDEDKYPLDLTYFGIDVAVRRVHVAIIGFPAHNDCLRRVSPDNKPVLLAAGSIGLEEKNTGFRELDFYIQRFNVMRCVIDRMPEFKNAAEFRSRHPGRVYTCGYLKWKNKPNFIYDFKYDKGVVEAGRTETLDVVYDCIRQRQIVFPRNISVVGGNVNKRGFGELPQHLMNLTRLIDQETQEAVYDEGFAPDHIAHALNYAFIAAQYNPLNGEEIRIVPGDMASITTLTKNSTGASTFMSLGLTKAQRGVSASRRGRNNIIVGSGLGFGGSGY